MEFVRGIKFSIEDKVRGEKLVSSLSEKAQKGYNDTIPLSVYEKSDGGVFAKYNGGTYKADSVEDLEKYLCSMVVDEEEQHLTSSEVEELSHNIDWGNPYDDPEDIKECLRTNWEPPLDEESVEAVYAAMCRIWDDKQY